MAEQTFKLDLLERFWIYQSLANERPVGGTPKQWRLAINLLERLNMEDEAVAECEGKPLIELHGKEEAEFTFTPDEAQFMVKMLILQRVRTAAGGWSVQPKGWVGGQLVYLIPLYDKLYPQWEQITPNKAGD